jgi:hypothetical protein
VPKVLRVHLVLQAHQEQVVPQELKEHKEHKVPKVIKEHKVM